MKYKIILTCEHAGQKIFPEVKKINIAKSIINSHRAYDAGAFDLAKILSSKLGSPLTSYMYTRLVLDGNRSEGNSALWGMYGKKLSNELKLKLFKKYYLTFRGKTKKLIESTHKPVLHISVHSMSSEIDNKKRECDVSLLYDPKRKAEAKVCKNLQYFFKLYGLKCRLNYPYLGVSDGHCTKLRKSYPASKYLGIELELNQKNIEYVELVAEILNSGLRYTNR